MFMNRSVSMPVAALSLCALLSGCSIAPYATGAPEVPEMKSQANRLRAGYCADVELAERSAAEREERSERWLLWTGAVLGTVALASVAGRVAAHDSGTKDAFGVTAATTGVAAVGALGGGFIVLGISSSHDHERNAATAAAGAVSIAAVDEQRDENSKPGDALDKESKRAFRSCSAIEGDSPATPPKGDGAPRQTPKPPAKGAP